MRFGVPMVWREPENHHDDCYFSWWICLDGINERRKIGIILILSLLNDPYYIALKFSLPDLTADEMLLEAMDDTNRSDSIFSSSSSMTALPPLLRAKPKPFGQGQLNDLVSDFGLSKESFEIVISRLGEHGILDS